MNLQTCVEYVEADCIYNLMVKVNEIIENRQSDGWYLRGCPVISDLHAYLTFEHN